MKSKRILIGVLSVIFVAVVIIAVFMMFTIKEVNVKFSVYSDSVNTIELQEKFNKYNGENLIFLDAKEISKKVDVGPRFEIESVKKSYPNVLEINVKERKERFVISLSSGDYIISDQGYVLGTATGEEKLVRINLSGISVNDVVLGQKIITDHDEDFYNALTLADVEGVVDASNEMTVEYVGKTLRSVIFLTKTDVRIRIPMATEYGVEKTQTGFSAYFNESRDYIKSYSEIRVDIQPDGTLKTVWIQQ